LAFLGDIYLAKEDLDQARDVFQQMIDLNSEAPQGHFRMALLYLQTNRPVEAIKHLELAMHRQPDFVPALRLLLSVHHEQNQPEKALAAARQSARKAPLIPELHQLLGEELLLQNQPRQAAEAFEEALRLKPDQPRVVELLAQAYAGLEDQAQIVQELEARLREPQTPNYYFVALARLFEKQGALAQAIALYRRMLERDPHSVAVRNNLAYLLAEHQPNRENLAEAKKLASEALDDTPNAPQLLDTMGWILCREGNYEAAKQYLEKAVTRAPNHPVMLYHLGFCAANLGKIDLARDSLEKSLAAEIDFREREDAKRLLEGLK
jgi:tetratricopeptide (TPR) repeat protein